MTTRLVEELKKKYENVELITETGEYPLDLLGLQGYKGHVEILRITDKIIKANFVDHTRNSVVVYSCSQGSNPPNYTTAETCRPVESDCYVKTTDLCNITYNIIGDVSSNHDGL